MVDEDVTNNAPLNTESHKSNTSGEYSPNAVDDTPKKTNPKKLIALIVGGLLILLLCCCCGFLFFMGSSMSGSEEFKAGYCEGLGDSPDPFGIC